MLYLKLIGKRNGTMRKILTAATLAFLTLFSAAEAQQSVVTMERNQQFLTETAMIGTDGPLSLCLQQRTLTAFDVPIASEATGYSLSDNRCAEPNGVSLEAANLGIAQEQGLIPANVPALPAGSIETDLLLIALITVVALATFAVIWRRVKSLLGYDLNPPMRKKAAQKLLAVLVLAASAARMLRSSDITFIADTTRRLTRRPCDPAHVSTMVDKLHIKPIPADTLAKGLRDAEKEEIMFGALFVCFSEGQLAQKEYDYLIGLARAFGIPGQEFRTLVREATDEVNRLSAMAARKSARG